MYGDSAQKLVLESKRMTNLSEIPLYQHDLIRDVTQEISDLNKDIEFLNGEQSREEGNNENETEKKRINQCQLFVTHLCLRRNKRCMLAYEKLRADKMDEFSWLNVDPITNTDSSASNSRNMDQESSKGAMKKKSLNLENLSHPEQEYFKHYQELILHFKSTFNDIDLSGDLEPPTDIFIDVRVLKDGGEVQTEYGVFNLIKNSQFYVRKSDVDRLIQQGYLEEI